MALVPRSILKHFFIYASGSALLKCLSLGLIPFLLRVVPPQEYGILALAMSVAGITSHILDLGLRQYLLIDYFKRSPVERLRLILDIALFYMCISIPILSALFVAAPWISPAVAGKSVYIMTFCIVTHVFFSFFAELFYQVLRNEQHVLLLTSVQSVVTLGTMGLNIGIATHFHAGALGMLIGYITGLATASFIGLGWLLLRLRKSTEIVFISVAHHSKQGSRYLPFSLPLLPTTLLSWIFSSGDKWILALYATLTDVGIYALGDTVGTAFHLLVIYPLASSYIPYLVQRYAAGQTPIQELEHQNKKIMVMTLCGLTVASMSAYWLGRPLMYWFLPPHYHPVIPYIPLLLVGYILLTGTYFLSALIQFHNRRAFLAYSLVIPATVNLALNRVLVPRYQLYGSMYATIAAYSVYFGGLLWYNVRLTQQLGNYIPAHQIENETGNLFPQGQKERELVLSETPETDQISTLREPMLNLSAKDHSRNQKGS